jgi:hypothetical protein
MVTKKSRLFVCGATCQEKNKNLLHEASRTGVEKTKEGSKKMSGTDPQHKAETESHASPSWFSIRAHNCRVIEYEFQFTNHQGTN